MKMKKILTLALATAMSLSTLAGCGSSSSSAAATSGSTTDSAASEATSSAASEAGSAVESTVSGDGFNITVNFASEPQTMDPALNTTVDGGVMAHHLFEGLMKWTNSGKEIDGTNGKASAAEITYGQAESYDKTENEDGTVTYVFHLRDGIKWSDGKDVTAEDFAYSWRRLADPNTAADYSYMLSPVVNADEITAGEKDPSELGVEATDDKTFTVTLKNECAYFEELCAFPSLFPVRQDVIEEKGDQWTFDTASYISNGAYKLKSWEHNSAIVMEKNENYYDVANLGPDTITFKLMDDENAMLSGYNSGELDFIERVPQAEVTSMIASGDLNIVNYLGTYYVCFQNEKAPFDDPRVREAFTLAIDRTYLVEKVTQTGQVEADGYVPSGVNDAAGATGDDFRTVGGSYYSVNEDDYQANCDKARELLKEAGYENGEGFPVVEYLYNTDDNHKAIAEALKSMWEEELGVTVTLNNQEWAAFVQTRKDGDYSIARNGWIGDYNDPMTFLDMFKTGGGNNDAKYSNKEFDELIDKANTTVDVAERMSLMHQAEDLLVGQDNAIAPLYFYTQYFMLKDDIKGMYYTPLGFFFFGYTQKG